jgi:putative hemin transport protein
MSPRTVPTDPFASTRAAYAEARRNGLPRHRDIAARLGISEGELIAAHVQINPAIEGLHARRLRPEWPQIVAALEAAGEVMALTRNASCVHEKTGTYQNTSHSPHAGLVLGEEIDLRVFYNQWAHGFAVDELGAHGMQRSLQFFDGTGTAVHKVFVKPLTETEAWDALVSRYAQARQQSGLSPAPARTAPLPKPDAEVDVAAFRNAWASMRDTHEFFGLLKRHSVARTQALRLADPRFVRAVDAHSAQQLLESAAAGGTPIMVFVGNPGVIQIHTGPVCNVGVMGPWLNVLDARFNLHLREDHIAAAWVVKKPTSDGLVTSLELFDAAGETIAMFFGERKPGRPELCAWRELIERLHGDVAQAEPAACTP